MLVKNKYGYYEVEKKPTEQELQKYYADKYYQDSKGSYLASYSAEEITYTNNKLEQKELVIHEINSNLGKGQRNQFLDLGCGEGWALNFFRRKDWDVTGLDYSEYGVESQNKECLPYLISGDIFENIESLIDAEKTFDVIMLDNVLEHVIDPKHLLERIRLLIRDGGVFILDVPNDFSTVHLDIIERKHISREFWVAPPDHLSYFNKEGLNRLVVDAGWKAHKFIADFPIEMYLYNSDSNYIDDKAKGPNCHKARLQIENLFSRISNSKTVNLYEAMADMGIGRQIIAFLQKES